MSEINAQFIRVALDVSRPDEGKDINLKKLVDTMTFDSIQHKGGCISEMLKYMERTEEPSFAIHCRCSAFTQFARQAEMNVELCTAHQMAGALEDLTPWDMEYK